MALKLSIIVFSIVLLFILFLFYFRRRKFKRLDLIEQKKLELKKMPILEEFSNFKKMGVQGETEDQVLQLRKQLNDLNATDFREAEILIFEAEDYIKQYRFSLFDTIEKKIYEVLDHIEQKIADISVKAEQLRGASEKNINTLLELQEKFRDLKKSIVIHGHFFRESTSALETEIDSELKFFSQIEQKNNDKDFWGAAKILEKMEKKYNDIMNKTIMIPELYQKCESLRLHQFEKAHEMWQELQKDRYSLTHIKFDETMIRLNEDLLNIVELLNNANVEEANSTLGALYADAAQLEEQLKQELEARAHVNLTKDQLDTRFFNFVDLANEIITEAENVNLAFFSEQDGNDKFKLHGIIDKLRNEWDEVRKLYLERASSYSMISHKIKMFEDDFYECEKIIYNSQAKIENLKEVEVKTKNKLAQLRQELKSVGYILNKVNVEKIPDKINDFFEKTEKLIENINLKLHQKPINSEVIQSDLDKTIEYVENAKEASLEFVVEVNLIETLIQYGNRYRIGHPEVAEKFSVAEESFASGKYRQALIEVERVIAEVDSNYINNITLSGKDRELLASLKNNQGPISSEKNEKKSTVNKKLKIEKVEDESKVENNDHFSKLEKSTDLSQPNGSSLESELQLPADINHMLESDDIIGDSNLPDLNEKKLTENESLKLLLADLKDHEENLTTRKNVPEVNISVGENDNNSLNNADEDEIGDASEVNEQTLITDNFVKIKKQSNLEDNSQNELRSTRRGKKKRKR